MHDCDIFIRRTTTKISHSGNLTTPTGGSKMSGQASQIIDSQSVDVQVGKGFSRIELDSMQINHPASARADHGGAKVKCAWRTAGL